VRYANDSGGLAASSAVREPRPAVRRRARITPSHPRCGSRHRLRVRPRPPVDIGPGLGPVLPLPGPRLRGRIPVRPIPESRVPRSRVPRAMVRAAGAVPRPVVLTGNRGLPVVRPAMVRRGAPVAVVVIT